MQIPIDKERGVDPHLTFCPRCGGDSNSLTIGVIMKAEYAPGQWCYANRGRTTETGRELENKGVIRNRYDLQWIEVTNPQERIPDPEPCDKCKAEIAEHKNIVAQGGVYFKCDQCGISGVIKDSLFAQHVRQQHGAEFEKADSNGLYKPCGIAFDKCKHHQFD